MAELTIGCTEVIVINPPDVNFILAPPTPSTVIVQNPDNSIIVSNPVPPKIIVEEPNPNQFLVPVLGVPGPPGPSGGGSGGGAPRYTYIDPVQDPNGVRTVFTVPFPYVLGSLAVYLNGLQENYVSQLTTTTFSFDTAPISTDTIKVEFDAII